MNLLIIIIGIVVVVIVAIGYVLTVLDFAGRVVSLWRRYVLNRRDPTPATAEDIARVEAKLKDIQQTIAKPPGGSPSVDTKALAAHASAAPRAGGDGVTVAELAT